MCKLWIFKASVCYGISVKGFKIKETPMFNKKEYSGRVIRKRISENKSWEKLVPKPCINIVKKTMKSNKT